MKKTIFLFALYFSRCIFSVEVATVPMTVSVNVLPLEEKVVSVIEKDFKEIKLTNIFLKDIFILGKADTRPFLYKIESGITKTFRINAKIIDELFYILDGKKYKLVKYSDIKNIEIKNNFKK